MESYSELLLKVLHKSRLLVLTCSGKNSIFNETFIQSQDSFDQDNNTGAVPNAFLIMNHIGKTG